MERATTNSLVTTPMVVIEELCTFEPVVKRFGIDDRAVRKIAEMIHDADLEDGKFQRNEALGINRILRGWAKLGVSDEEILFRGFQCIDALYADLK
ncbi:chromate resistance protein ChrB domain-containing protein [Verrucomicrobiota bacterium sgz303538]